MKKKSLKSLALNKKSISKLNRYYVSGGAANQGNNVTADPVGDDIPSRINLCGKSWDESCQWSVDFCPSIDIPTIDIPTINDSCFSLCRYKCNDW